MSKLAKSCRLNYHIFNEGIKTNLFTLRNQSDYILETCISLLVSEKGAPRPSMLALVYNIVTQEGVSGLYRGISPNLLKVIPAVSVSYVVYEYTRMFLGVDFEGRRGGKGNG